MVGSIDPRCETVRGTHWPKKVAWLFGARVAETILASGPKSPHQQAGHMDASDPIRPSKKLLWHGGRPHMGPCFRRDDREEGLAQTHPLRFAFAAIDNSARWAITAASAGCLRISSAAVASCSMITTKRAALQLRSAVSTFAFREKCRRGNPLSSNVDSRVPSAIASA